MDRFLGPYPYENFKKWVSLTNHITKDLLERIQPKCKKISSVTELPIDPQYPGMSGSAAKNAVLSVGLNPDAVIRFTKFPKHRYPDGASPLEISKHSIDSSYALSCMLDSMKGELCSCLGKWASIQEMIHLFKCRSRITFIGLVAYICVNCKFVNLVFND